MKYTEKCPLCGNVYRVPKALFGRDYNICPKCFWEHDSYDDEHLADDTFYSDVNNMSIGFAKELLKNGYTTTPDDIDKYILTKTEEDREALLRLERERQKTAESP